ncbi:ABC transporter permease [Paeniglutamicibacter sp. NPDC012692]|uniref:ABC transporter permease n=1 Tax=Paeniglutamicibacter sp. NPDC012692 TaxID=3364388 RepID=UPI0036872D39
MSAPVTQRPPETTSTLGYLAGIGTIFKLEILQRVRSRGWYIMLAIWFLVIAGVVALAAVSVGSEGFGAGQVMFELVVAFVLFFGMLIAPALSSNSITGDRANGTLAILQNTLLTPGQLLIGKWLAAWIASLGFLVVTIPLIGWAMTYGDVYPPGVPVLLGMLALELAVVCAIGVGVSALANRTLFAVLISYLLVAMLGLGTLIGFGLSMELVKTDVMVSEQVWPDEYSNGDGSVAWDENNYTCGTALYPQTTYATERITWLLAANPFVVVADAAPRPAPDPSSQSFDTMGPMGGISETVRMSQAGQMTFTPCINGVKSPEASPANATPLWPLGLGLQLLLAAGLLVAGRRKLHTPAGKLASGTRIA